LACHRMNDAGLFGHQSALPAFVGRNPDRLAGLFVETLELHQLIGSLRAAVHSFPYTSVRNTEFIVLSLLGDGEVKIAHFRISIRIPLIISLRLDEAGVRAGQLDRARTEATAKTEYLYVLRELVKIDGKKVVVFNKLRKLA